MMLKSSSSVLLLWLAVATISINVHAQQDNMANLTRDCSDAFLASLYDCGPQTTTQCFCDEDSARCTYRHGVECETVTCAPGTGARCPLGAPNPLRSVCTETRDLEIFDITSPNAVANETYMTKWTQTVVFRSGIANIHTINIEHTPSVPGGELDQCEAAILKPDTNVYEYCNSCAYCDHGLWEDLDCSNIIPEQGNSSTCDVPYNQFMELDIPTCDYITASLPDRTPWPNRTQDSKTCECQGQEAICTYEWKNVCDEVLECGESVRCSDPQATKGRVCRDFTIMDVYAYNSSSPRDIPYDGHTTTMSSTFLDGTVMEPQGTMQLIDVEDGVWINCTAKLLVDTELQECNSCSICPDTRPYRSIFDCTNVLPDSVVQKCDMPPGTGGPFIMLVDNDAPVLELQQDVPTTMLNGKEEEDETPVGNKGDKDASPTSVSTNGDTSKGGSPVSTTDSTGSAVAQTGSSSSSPMVPFGGGSIVVVTISLFVLVII